GEGVWEEVDLRDAQMLEQRRDVVGGLLEAQGTIDVGRAAMALQIGGDPPPVGGERGMDAAMAPGRMNIDRRLSPAADRVAHLESIHGRIALDPLGNLASRSDGDGHRRLPICKYKLTVSMTLPFVKPDSSFPASFLRLGAFLSVTPAKAGVRDHRQAPAYSALT